MDAIAFHSGSQQRPADPHFLEHKATGGGDIKLGFSTDAAPRWADES
jgi:hypothetical protein